MYVSTLRSQRDMQDAWLARGREGGFSSVELLVQLSGGTRFCGTAGTRGLCRVEREPQAPKKSRQLWAICHLPPLLPTPQFAPTPNMAGTEGVKIHTQPLSLASWRQELQTEGKCWAEEAQTKRWPRPETPSPVQRQLFASYDQCSLHPSAILSRFSNAGSTTELSTSQPAPANTNPDAASRRQALQQITHPPATS